MSEYIKLKMMALVVPTRFWVIILPGSIVDGYPHFLRIAMIKIIRAFHISISVIVLGIPDIRVMIETIPVVGVV